MEVNIYIQIGILGLLILHSEIWFTLSGFLYYYLNIHSQISSELQNLTCAVYHLTLMSKY